MAFTVTPGAGYEMTLTGLRLDYAVNGDSFGMDAIAAVRSSADSYAEDLLAWDPPAVSGGTSLPWDTKAGVLGAAFADLTDPVTFRIYLADNKNVAERGHLLDNIRVSGLAVSETTPPTVEAYVPTPPAGATGVPVMQDLQLNFGEAIRKVVSGNLFLNQTDGDDDRVIAVGDAAVTIGSSGDGDRGDLVTIALADLAPLANYAVRIDPGAFTDWAATPNDYAGITNDTTWYFTTADLDTTDPTVESYTPGLGAAAVTPDADIVLDFTEAVVAGSGNIEIRDMTGAGADTRTVAVGSVVLSHGDDPGSDLATIDPGIDLRRNHTYAVLVAATAFDDIVGNSYAGITNATFWQFQTETDVTPPSVLTYSPANDAADVAVPGALTLTFDENVEAGTGAITIKNLTDATEVTINLPAQVWRLRARP